MWFSSRKKGACARDGRADSDFLKIFLNFWLCWVFAAVCELSLVCGLSLVLRLLLFHSMGSRAQQLWFMGLVALQHVES